MDPLDVTNGFAEWSSKISVKVCFAFLYVLAYMFLTTKLGPTPGALLFALIVAILAVGEELVKIKPKE